MDTLCRCCPDKRAFPETSDFCPVARADEPESPNSPPALARHRTASRRCVKAEFPQPLFRLIPKCLFDSSSKNSINQLAFDLFQCPAFRFRQLEFDEHKSRDTNSSVEPEGSR